MAQSNTLRIIGGRWRGRKLHFPKVPGLRPTPDRVRETLFNWLQAQVPGARCLDLFCGSGALGLEAASRGAAEVWWVDRDRRATGAMASHLAALDAGMGQVFTADVARWLARPGEPFDLVFLDPPYGRGLLAPAVRALEEGGWLRDGARIYLEVGEEGLPPLPEPWRVLRSGHAGQVGYHLFARDGSFPVR